MESQAGEYYAQSLNINESSLYPSYGWMSSKTASAGGSFRRSPKLRQEVERGLLGYRNRRDFIP